jgi:putative aldouronate transport system permease protein
MMLERRIAKKPSVIDARYWKKIGYRLAGDWRLYALLLPALAYFILFCYLPMYGVQIAFMNFRGGNLANAKWVGLKNFEDFFFGTGSFFVGRMFKDTLLLNLYGLLWGFPMPILLALLLNQLRNEHFKRFTQTVIYIPHFISTVVLVGMLYLFFDQDTGIFNIVRSALGTDRIYFMDEARWFRTLFIGSDVWAHTGWNTILYIAALTSVDQEIYEAATIDGASKLQKIRYIDIPSLIPLATMLLILNSGTLMMSNTDKALIMQTGGNMETSDIIGVYVFKMGFGQTVPYFSYAAAVGLFINVINFVLIITVNTISKRFSSTSLF